MGGKEKDKNKSVKGDLVIDLRLCSNDFQATQQVQELKRPFATRC